MARRSPNRAHESFSSPGNFATSAPSIVQRYANLSGNSGVVAYQTGADSITVEFVNGQKYLYNYQSAGPANVETMKKLAARGQGLSAFISTTVGNGYAKRW